MGNEQLEPHKNGKMLSTISKEICSTQSRSRKEQERTSIGCLKQKLFDNVNGKTDFPH